jgi:hypothetical protein
MFGSNILEIILALTFIYLLLGLACTVIYELIAGMMRLRARELERGIHALLKDPALVKKFYDHPIIRSLWVGPQLPSYIPSRSFALALLDIVAGSGPYPYPERFKDIRQTLYELPEDGPTGDLKRALLVVADEADGNIKRVRESVEAWFDSVMERVSSLYKQRALVSILFLSTLLTVAANVNTIEIARGIWMRPVLQDSIATAMNRRLNQAPSYAPVQTRPSPQSSANVNTTTAPSNVSPAGQAPTPQTTPTSPEDTSEQGRRGGEEFELRRAIDSLSLPLGWYDSSSLGFITPFVLLTLLLGWLITALAVSLCATFWFDTLNKFILFRSAVKPREREFELRQPLDRPDGDGDYFSKQR